MEESKPEEWRMCNKRSAVLMFMKKDGGNLLSKGFFGGFFFFLVKITNLFTWLLLFSHCSMVAWEQLSSELYVHGQISFHSKCGSKNNRLI